MVLEGYEEPHVADVITRELRDVMPDDERWAAKFKVLKESLEHHIKEEERNTFRPARAAPPLARRPEPGRVEGTRHADEGAQSREPRLILAVNRIHRAPS